MHQNCAEGVGGGGRVGWWAGRQPSVFWGQLHPAHANRQYKTRFCDQWGGNGVAIIYRITRPLDPTIHLAFAILFARLERTRDWGRGAGPYCRNHSFHLSPSAPNLLRALYWSPPDLETGLCWGRFTNEAMSLSYKDFWLLAKLFMILWWVNE